MKLIERTNTTSLQSILTCPRTESKDKVNLILKMNMLARLYSSIKSDLTEIEIKKLVPTLNIKVSKFDTNEGKSMYLANLNTSNNPNKDYNLPKTLEKEFSDLGIELPSNDITNDRLNSFSEEDITDPFRLKNIEFSDTYSIDVELKDFKDGLESDFFDSFYSGTEANKELYKSKIHATCILVLSDFFKKEPNFELTPEIINTLIEDIHDKDQKDYVAKDLMEFYKDPSSRNRKIIEAKRVINLPDPKDKSGKPIATWKIVTAASIVLLGVLAYTQREAIKTALNISRESKSLETSKFRLFAKSLFTKSGRKESKSYMETLTHDKEDKGFLKSIDWRKKSAIARISKSKYVRDEIKSRWLGR